MTLTLPWHWDSNGTATGPAEKTPRRCTNESNDPYHPKETQPCTRATSAFTVARKHTAHVERDLPQLIERAVGRLGDLRQTQESRFAAYKERELADGAAHDLVVQALDARVVPVTHIPAVLAEWRPPRHEEFRGGKTAWRLVTALTEALKGNFDAMPRRTQALHGLLDAACGLAVSRA